LSDATFLEVIVEPRTSLVFAKSPLGNDHDALGAVVAELVVPGTTAPASAAAIIALSALRVRKEYVNGNLP
jgi:hypothetical protein